MDNKIMKNIKAKETVAKKGVSAKKVTATKKTASREVVAKQANVLATRLAAKLDERMEKILADAEELVKEYFPAKYVSASLTKLQKNLISNGISCRFDKTVTKEALASTDKADITEDECTEAIEKIAQAVVDETEETLELCDTAIRNLAKKHFPKHRVSSARSMRKNVASAMKKTGLNFKF